MMRMFGHSGLGALVLALALALGAGCPTKTRDGTFSTPPGGASGGAAGGASGGTWGGRSSTTDGGPPTRACEDPPPSDPPAWAAKAASPVPSPADLTGSWLPVHHPGTYPPGAVPWRRSCYGGHAMFILEQHGADVRATWSRSAGVSGALPERWHATHEVTLGTRTGHVLELHGVQIQTSGPTMGDGPTERECTPWHYRLTYDAATQRLVGTANGNPVEFAAAIIDDRPPQDCGDPPP